MECLLKRPVLENSNISKHDIDSFAQCNWTMNTLYPAHSD